MATLWAKKRQWTTFLQSLCSRNGFGTSYRLSPLAKHATMEHLRMTNTLSELPCQKSAPTPLASTKSLPLSSEILIGRNRRDIEMNSSTLLPQLNFQPENGKEEPAMGFQIDLQRICKVVFRTVKGLLWSESCIRLPDDFGIVMAPYFNLKFLEQDLLNIFLHILLAEQTSKKEKKVVIPGHY